MSKAKVVQILCRRDGETPEDAEYRVDSAIQQMEEENFEPFRCEEILMDDLGLEPDYIMDLFF